MSLPHLPRQPRHTEVQPADAVEPAVLVVTADALLTAEVRRLAAAAGVVPIVCEDPAGALPSWSAPTVVLVGADLAAAVARQRPPRRPLVQVLTLEAAGEATYRDAVTLGAEAVIELPGSEQWLVELLSDVADDAPGEAAMIGVVAGCGGAGATTFAAALAGTAARVTDTVLVDLDVLGAGVERVLGLERVEGVRWDALTAATGRLGARSLRDALPRADRLHVLTHPAERAPELSVPAAREALSAARRGFGCVVLDLPRHDDPAAHEAIARCDDVLLVSTLTVPAVTAAHRVADRLPSAHRWLVTRGGAGSVEPEGAADLLGMRLMHAMGRQRGLEEAIDLGAGPLRSRHGPLARAARECLARLLAPRERP